MAVEFAEPTVREPLRIEVLPLDSDTPVTTRTQTNAVSVDAVEPLRVEVLAPDSNDPVLVRRRGDTEFKPAPGGDLVRPNRASDRPVNAPPKQSAKHQADKATGGFARSEWKTRQPRSQTNPRVSRSAASGAAGSPLVDTARGEFLGSFFGGIVDELVNRPAERAYQQNIVLDDLGNRAAYDTGRRFADFSRDVVNSGWDNLKDAWENKPDIGLPELDLPRISFPEVKPPQIDLPDLDLPQFELPDLKLPQFDLPEFDLPRLVPPELKLPEWLKDFPAINLPEIGKQQEIETIRNKERERQTTREIHQDTDTKTIYILEQLDDGCILYLTYSRIRFRVFDEFVQVQNRQVATYTRTDWEPFQMYINPYNEPGLVNEYIYIDGSEEDYLALYNYDYTSTNSSGFTGNTQKYITSHYLPPITDPTATYLEVELLKVTIPINSETRRLLKEDINYILYDDSEQRYLPDKYNSTFVTNINKFAFARVSSNCPIEDLPPKPEQPIPPEPPIDKPMKCCSCSEIALILKKTLQSMKFKIKVPIISCELENENWLPKVAYKTLEVFAVDAATATAQAEVYKEMAIQARELCYAKNVIESVDKLSKAVGVDEYPASLPSSLITEDEGFIGNLIPNPNTEVKNLTQLIGWVVERFDEIAGQFEIPIEIKDSDPTTPGDQPKGIKIPNIAEGIAEIMGLLLQTTINSETLVSLTTRTLIETGQDKQQNFKGYMLLQALTEYIGFNYEDKKILLPMTFTPGKESLDEMLQETDIEVAVPEYNEKLNLQADLARYRKAAGIIDSVFFRKINPNADAKPQVMKYIKDAYDLARKVNKEDDKDFEKFLEDAEIGFTKTPGISDSTNPYGNSYSERPKIRDLSSNNGSNQ